LFLRVFLKLESDARTKYDTRISIGMGEVETISKRRISDSRGPAFTFSGKGMDAMNGQRLSFAHEDAASFLWESLAKAIIPLVDGIIGDWTPTESRAVYGALKGWTQEEIAKNWPTNQKTGKKPTRQAVGDSLSRAHWNSVDAVLLWMEKKLKQAI